MLYNIFIVILSLTLENIFNVYLNEFIYLSPLFTLISLIFIYPFFRKQRKKYYICSIIIGFIYDLFFTNFYVLNALLFFICSTLIYFIFDKKEYNIKYVFLNSIIAIFIYNVLIYFILNFFNYIDYTLIEFANILKYFFISNIIYTIFMYILSKRFYFKNKI